MSEPRTAAGRRVFDEADFHQPHCPVWTMSGVICECALLRFLAQVEAQARREAIDAALAVVRGLTGGQVWEYRKPPHDVLDRDAVIQALTELRDAR